MLHSGGRWLRFSVTNISTGHGSDALGSYTRLAARLTATDAQRLQLVDEVSADLDAHLRLLGRRLERVHPTTVGDLKRYMRRMWIVDDDMEQAAVRELARLTVDPRVTRNIKNFVELGQLPWESW